MFFWYGLWTSTPYDFPSQVLPSFHKATISCTCVGTNGIQMDPDVWNASFNLRFQTFANFKLSHCQNVPNESLRRNVGYITLSSYHLYCLLAGHLKKRSFLPHFFPTKGVKKKSPTWKQMSRPSKVLGQSGDWFSAETPGMKSNDQNDQNENQQDSKMRRLWDFFGRCPFCHILFGCKWSSHRPGPAPPPNIQLLLDNSQI